MPVPTMSTYAFTLYFPGMFISDPYWPEVRQLIDLQKEAGSNRARSPEKRAQRLEEYLKRNGISHEEYQEMLNVSERPWYRLNRATYSGPIIVSSHQLYGCLIATADKLSKNQRPCDPENLRSLLIVSDFITDKNEEDGIYTRVVQPKTGTGQPLSNQRGLRSDPYISNFEAKGTISFCREMILNDDELPDFVTYAGTFVGVGAARKMNCGRFEVKEWDVIDNTKKASHGRQRT